MLIPVICIAILLIAVAAFALKPKKPDQPLKESPSNQVEKDRPKTKHSSLKTDTLYQILPQDEKELFKNEQKNGYMISVIKGKREGFKKVLIGKKITIGRSPVNDFAIEDPRISEKHLMLDFSKPDSIILKDLGSTNGTMVNKKVISSKELTLEDVIQIGNTQLMLLKDE